MGRKRTAEDRRRYAENSFDDDDTDIDDNPIPRDVLEYTKERYDVQMELWFEYVTSTNCPPLHSWANTLEDTKKKKKTTSQSHSPQVKNSKAFRRVHGQFYQRRT